MKRFALYSRPAIEQAPLQTYCSALIFAPAKSIVRNQFECKKPGWMQRLPEVQEGWRALLQTFKGHRSFVGAVAFSSDGKLLASASSDRTIKLCGVTTGVVVKTFEGHADSVTAVAFSPDGKLLASASLDHTIMVWDSTTGVAVKTLESHTGSVHTATFHTVIFSLDGKLLASALGNKTVKL